MAPLLITAPRLITGLPGDPIAEPGYVLASDGVIAAAGPGPPPGEPGIALPEGVLVPGFVDLQVNGYYGVDFAAADPAGWAYVARRLPETGTTAFAATCVSAPLPRLATLLRSAAALLPGLRRGARVLGVHLEGPFISAAQAGAHRRDWIVPPSPEAVAGLLAAGEGVLRLVTLAPETAGGLAAVRAFARAGVLVSVGHSDATAHQVAAAADAGARMVTHLFNAQRGFHHREPGVVGQALTDPRLTSGLIADFQHVSAAACAVAFAAAPGRICLVSDAVACAGLPPGRYQVWGEPADLPPGDAVAVVRADGRLIGSALRLDRAVANMVGNGTALPDAVAAATRIPADLVGRADLGRLAPGAAADVAWLGDDLVTRATWAGGEQVYPAAGAGVP